ncbi:MAG: sulfatase [Pirellulaceae bacterium]|nr:sulfatase [Pirellulaceae bacterium]
MTITRGPSNFVSILMILAAMTAEFHFEILTVSAAERLNVLMIAVDDLGNVLNSERKSTCKTPHLDAFAFSSVRFDRAYCQLPLCNPTRASLLTGLRPDTIGVYDLDRHFRDQVPDAVTLPQFFRQQGWFSARVGKLYHYDVPAGIGTNGLDDAPSWDYVVNPKGRDVAEEAIIVNPTPEKKVSAALSWLAAEGTDEEQTDGQIASEAIEILEKQIAGRDKKPFFLGVGFFRPHTPFVAPKKYFDLYPLESIELPKAPENDRDDIPIAAFAHNNPTPNYGLDELTCRKALQAYFASVSFVDAQIGRVLDAVQRLGLASNTVVVIWSDHGYHLGEHRGAWQKRTLFEESSRAPLLFRVPNAKGNGKACKAIVEFVDIYPTIVDVCGLEIATSLAGRSLRPMLDAPQQDREGAAITQVLRPADSRFSQPVMGRSIRTNRWRYTEWDEGREGIELYDHNNDPNEFHNLATEPTFQAQMVALKQQLSSKAIGTPPSTPFNPARL